MVDECYLLGSAHPNNSYLNIEKIIAIAQKAKVDAIHPGYGFLSESEEFANHSKQKEMILHLVIRTPVQLSF